jgi:hypothetical protein
VEDLFMPPEIDKIIELDLSQKGLTQIIEEIIKI